MSVRPIQGLLERVNHHAQGNVEAYLYHSLSKFFPVLALLYGFGVGAYELHIIFLQNTTLIKLHRQIESGLSAKSRQEGVRTLFGYYFFKDFRNQWLYVGDIGHLRIRHNCGGIGIDQYHFIAFFPKGFTGLASGVVEFAGLAYNNRPRTHD